MRFICCLLLLATVWAQNVSNPSNSSAPSKQQVLWQKLEANISDVDHGLDGVLGVAILDLSSGQKFLLHSDDVFPQASSIKVAVLAELYRQSQAGKLKLTELKHHAQAHGGKRHPVQE